MTTGPRPKFTAAQATAQARALVGRGVYQLGAGDIDSRNDDPRDCFGFAVCELYGLKRHRPGFNRGAWATVSDDLNCNSAIEDADHAGELFERVMTPAPGILLAYPTIHLAGRMRPWIGHICIIVGVTRCLEWDHGRPDWSLLDIVHCHGPDGRRPGITAGTGDHWNLHDHDWPKPEHRSAMLRVKP